MTSRRAVELGPPNTAATSPARAAGAPIDHAAETPALNVLARRGFRGPFVADGDALRVAGTDRRFRPEDVRVRDYYRFEGTSDPDDMSVAYALEAVDGTRGVLVDAFGSYADPAVGALLDHMPLDRAGGRARGRWRPAIVAGATLGLVALAALGARRARRGRSGRRRQKASAAAAIRSRSARLYEPRLRKSSSV